MENKIYTIALAGNPNVGKSTLFNSLTGMKQHTGNWPGKTVSGAVGYFNVGEKKIRLVDVPGSYSLEGRSAEEKIAGEYIKGERDFGENRTAADLIAVVCDACTLGRSLILALEIMASGKNVVLCVNLIDEAKSRGVSVNVPALSELLGIPAAAACAVKRGGLYEFLALIDRELENPNPQSQKLIITNAEQRAESAAQIEKLCVKTEGKARRREEILDRFVTGKFFAYPIAAILLLLVFYITLSGAVPISDGLLYLSALAENAVLRLFSHFCVPEIITEAFCYGVLRTTLTVISVMLPPMAIFFPLFTFLEDFGFLGRVAYNFDRFFAAADSCGKQALTMMMSLGCNAAGVTGARIIDSPRERNLAVITASFIPCNGKLPVLAALIGVMLAFSGVSQTLAGAIMALLIILAAAATLLAGKILSKTVLKGESSAFTIELPSYRFPRIGEILVRSVFDRTLFVLGRAVAVAAPAGLVIWVLGKVNLGSESLLAAVTDFLSPIGDFAGMDGVIICAFILSLPAAELTLPLMLMGYAGGGMLSVSEVSCVGDVFAAAGWSIKTALCATIFTLFHAPCATTLLTVKKETGSVFYTFLAAAIPTFIGYSLCVAVNFLFHLFG